MSDLSKPTHSGGASPEQVERNKAWLTKGAMEAFNQVEIVPTTKARYITGVYALNIPDEEGTTGDWHMDIFWTPKSQGMSELGKISLGGQDEFDTNSVFAELGVQEARDRVTGIGLHVAEHIKKVYVANHMRATLDLVFSELVKYGQVQYAVGGSVDWLDTKEQQEELLNHATKLGELLVEPQVEELHKWISNERTLS